MPGIRNVDASLIKNFAITETAKVAFRCEVFNLFNHPQIWGIDTGFSADNPGGNISSSNNKFGQPNSWREARILQLALRLSFYIFHQICFDSITPAGEPPTSF